jgi:hypothetical protein
MSNVCLCPNCNGHKTVSRPPWIAGDQTSWTSTSTQIFQCPTCEGLGYILLPDSLSNHGVPRDA